MWLVDFGDRASRRCALKGEGALDVEREKSFLVDDELRPNDLIALNG